MTSVFDKAKTKRLKQIPASVSPEQKKANKQLIQQYQQVVAHCQQQPSGEVTRAEIERLRQAHSECAPHLVISPPSEN